jgi:chitodextrinase
MEGSSEGVVNIRSNKGKILRQCLGGMGILCGLLMLAACGEQTPNGQSQESNQISDRQAPTTPADLTAAPISSSQITLTWSAAADDVGVMGYGVFRNGQPIITTTTTSYDDTNLSPSTSYTYTVTAYDAAGNVSTRTNAASATTLAAQVPDQQAPTIPTNLTATPVSTSQINLTWGTSTDNVGVAGYRVFRNGQQIATTETINYTDTGLTAATMYSYTLSAFDAAGNTSTQTDTVSAMTQTDQVPDQEAPTTPDIFSASPASPSQIDLTWSASTDNTGVAGYRLFRDGIKIATTTATSYADTGLTSATTYSYTVLAYDAAGNESLQTATISATTLTEQVPDQQAPTTPANLVADPVSSSQIELTWSGSSDNVGVVGYRVFRDGTQIATTTTISYADTSLAAATTYAYTVLAYDAAGNLSSQSSAASATTLADQTPDQQAPTTPANLTATPDSSSQISLAWDASTDNVGVAGYVVFRDGTQIATTTTTSYADTALAAATTYAYTVLAYDEAGNLSTQSGAASATTDQAPDQQAPTTPANLTATPDSSSQISLAWDASTDNVGVTGYQIFRDGTQTATTTTTSYTDTGLTAATTYSYTVLAYDAAGNLSTQSSAASATTPSDQTPDQQAPTTPANLTATPVSSSQVTLAWSASTDNVGVAGYRVFRDGTQIATTTTTSYADTGLTAATTYAYTVLAYDAAGNLSAQTNAVSATTSATTRSYSTNFDLVENPIAEGGVWSHNGLDWSLVQTNNGMAFGTQTGTNGYDDSYAILSGFSPDHTVSGVIQLSSSIDTSCSHEVELLLRWSDSAHSAQGYEVVLSFDGAYAQVVRWNGTIGDFTVLANSYYPTLKDGDVFSASIAGNVITAYVNGNQIIQTTDSTYTSGNPGMGFFRRNCGTSADYGFRSFTASE